MPRQRNIMLRYRIDVVVVVIVAPKMRTRFERKIHFVYIIWVKLNLISVWGSENSIRFIRRVYRQDRHVHGIGAQVWGKKNNKLLVYQGLDGNAIACKTLNKTEHTICKVCVCWNNTGSYTCDRLTLFDALRSFCYCRIWWIGELKSPLFFQFAITFINDCWNFSRKHWKQQTFQSSFWFFGISEQTPKRACQVNDAKKSSISMECVIRWSQKRDPMYAREKFRADLTISDAATGSLHNTLKNEYQPHWVAGV